MPNEPYQEVKAPTRHYQARIRASQHFELLIWLVRRFDICDIPGKGTGILPRFSLDALH